MNSLSRIVEIVAKACNEAERKDFLKMMENVISAGPVPTEIQISAVDRAKRLLVG